MVTPSKVTPDENPPSANDHSIGGSNNQGSFKGDFEEFQDQRECEPIDPAINEAIMPYSEAIVGLEKQINAMLSKDGRRLMKEYFEAWAAASLLMRQDSYKKGWKDAWEMRKMITEWAGVTIPGSN